LDYRAAKEKRIIGEQPEGRSRIRLGWRKKKNRENAYTSYCTKRECHFATGCKADMSLWHDTDDPPSRQRGRQIDVE